MYFAGVANDGTEFLQRADFRTGACLHQDIAENSRFDGTGKNRAVAGISGQLVEQTVARAAADDVDHLDALANDLFELTEYGLVLQSEAFKRATDQRSFRIRHRLAVLFAEIADGAGHVGRVAEAGIIGIDKGAEGRGSFGEANELGVVELFPLWFESAFALLDQPKASDVFEEAIGAVHAALVGEIEIENTP